MKLHRSYTPEELRYLSMLSRMYPTVRAAGTEIVNLRAIMNLPKGCEHFISDVHGEHEAFLHILNSCSGVVRERIDLLFADALPEEERRQLATLVYYPKEKLELLKPEIEDLDAWYNLTLHRLIALARLTTERYSRSKVRKALPEDYAYIMEELLYTHGEEADKRDSFENRSARRRTLSPPSATSSSGRLWISCTWWAIFSTEAPVRISSWTRC